MELFLQFGHGMKSLSIEMAKKWGGLTTILSPRDMLPSQMLSWCREFKKNNVSCLFDPQCYCPKSELKKLFKYKYWDSSLNTNLGSVDSPETTLIKYVNEYNDIADTIFFIIPNILERFSETWKSSWVYKSRKLNVAARNVVKNKPILATLTLPSGFLMQREDEIELLIQEILTWDVDGYYIIAETPEKKYLVDNPLWLSNVFQLCAALKLANKMVVYGYGNHQLLPLSLLKIDAIASGTWLNVRSFTNRFIDTDEMKRKSTWVYYPPALSEYKLSFIDLAYSSGVIKDMQPHSDFSNEYSDLIFKTKALPSATGLTETTTFKYYLASLKKQIDDLIQPTYEATLSANEVLINTSEATISQLEKKGIFAQTRSFREIVDVNRAAMQLLDSSRGFSLSLSWNSL